jgi:hypothetical protein
LPDIRGGSGKIRAWFAAACGKRAGRSAPPAIGGITLVMREGPSPRRLAIGFVQPLLACGAMAAAVWAAHAGLRAAGLGHPAVQLVAMILVGAVVYVGAALVVCRATARDLLSLVNQAMRRPAAPRADVGRLVFVRSCG